MGREEEGGGTERVKMVSNDQNVSTLAPSPLPSLNTDADFLSGTSNVVDLLLTTSYILLRIVFGREEI